MPDDLTDDRETLAAEYVLGTLNADELIRANVLLDLDPDFRGKVRAWERRLGELHLMVEPVDPNPQLWRRIRARVGPPQPPTDPLASSPPLAPSAAFASPAPTEPEPLSEESDTPKFDLDAEPEPARDLDAPAKPDAVSELERALEEVRMHATERLEETPPIREEATRPIRDPFPEPARFAPLHALPETTRTSTPETISREPPMLSPAPPPGRWSPSRVHPRGRAWSQWRPGSQSPRLWPSGRAQCSIRPRRFSPGAWPPW